MASGRGSNLQSIIDSVKSGFIADSEIVLVVSDKADAFALERAREDGVDALHLDPKEFSSREDFDSEVAKRFKAKSTDLILLAGYLRIVSPALINEFPNRIMNIHPALLPSFPGLHGQRDALEYGVKVSGCTVHFVDPEVDHGPIIIQAAVPVLEGDDEASLAQRILAREHQIYPQAVKWFSQGRLRVDGRCGPRPQKNLKYQGI
jgi:phosphoribosylglycinamide formyltransferase-1